MRAILSTHGTHIKQLGSQFENRTVPRVAKDVTFETDIGGPFRPGFDTQR